ncbi:hypothetical protein KSP39_PZI001374 [Platanthera zijinensis]|uniref:tRNA nucleotidyltransferase/poly(A) polymerase RNA and SrmB- binding domain-containing protein n=1 Tax=Platanthera zijinensis TaxID=2320716 RepID=A0AAP0C262_9ASPA
MFSFFISFFASQVSSFDTVAKHVDDQEAIISPKLLKNYNEKDLTCWKNCMTQDFSINCLFFDPFKCKIYDYVDALQDLKSCTVRTVISPHLSFKEDCARILRGMRIAARLGLQFSKKTEAAILDLSSSIQSLGKDRFMMEMNFMMAHGAAASSINLLQIFKLLESIFPAHVSKIFICSLFL